MDAALHPIMLRIAEALERLTPAPEPAVSLHEADAFVWSARADRLEPVPRVSAVRLELLKGIAAQRDLLLQNTLRFAHGYSANNALLWGARGTGKSSLVKAVHAEILRHEPGVLALIEIAREDIGSLPELLQSLRRSDRRFVIFCDDLSFEREDLEYKALKSVLDGGIEGRPENTLFYATSNRRHLIAREMIENEQGTSISPTEATEEKVSLSDRFGLWIGFHKADQATYLAAVSGYVEEFGLEVRPEQLRAEALAWSATRGSRSGRVAWQFVQDLAGRIAQANGSTLRRS